MIIVKIWDADYPWDVRVEKIVTSLIDDGHEVHLVCRNKRMLRKYEYSKGLHIHRLPPIIRYSKINEALSFPAFFNPFWIMETNRVIKNVKPDLVLVRDLPLCLMGWFVAKINRLPVILDMAEDYPEQCKNVWKVKGFKLRNVFLRNPMLAGIVERISIKLVDHLIVVIEESMERLMNLGVPAEKMSVVKNTPVLGNAWTIASINLSESLKNTESRLRLVYVGLLDENRGVSNVINAMPELKKRVKGVSFFVIGSGTYADELQKLAQELGVQDSVIFKGWIDYKMVPSYIDACDIGVIPHHAIVGWHNTIPNKLFDYMQMGKPLLVSNVKATARIVREEKCGIVFGDNDIDDLVSAVQRLLNPVIRRKLGSRGKEAVIKEYNWREDSKKLIKSLESVISA